MEITCNYAHDLNIYINKRLCFIIEDSDKDINNDTVKLMYCKLSDTNSLGHFIKVAKFHTIRCEDIIKIFDDITEGLAYYEYLIGK